MNLRVLGVLITLWGAGIVIVRFMGDSEQALGEPLTRGDVGVLIFGWVLLGVGMYLAIKNPKPRRRP